MMRFKVVYGEKQVADSGHPFSPSAHKPREMSVALSNPKNRINVDIVEPTPLSRSDFYRVHEKQFVDGVLDLRRKNGFGNTSKSVADSLPYTSGAMYDAARLATPGLPACALVSGFHHAGYRRCDLGWFCTFNGLMVAAAKLISDDKAERVAIVDADMHHGNGTDDILDEMDEMGDKSRASYYHASLGKWFTRPSQAKEYLASIDRIHEELRVFKPSVIIYQSGADVHINDPAGGVLNEDQMYERDVKMFLCAKDLGTPLAWNLAGGYQRDKDGGIGYVVKLHLNTFRAAQQVYSIPGF